MGPFTRRIYTFLRTPPSAGARLALVAAAAALVAAVFLPLWEIWLVAPQYQEGLSLHIYAYKLIAGNSGQDLHEINNLNHYIGMREIKEADFIEMRWVPFALGVFVLLALRAAAIGIMRGVVDLLVLYVYFTAFSFGSFYYRLYTYGHQLDPRAPMTIKPFTPVLIGRQQIANFEQSSFPDSGTIFLTLFPLLLVLALWLSRKETVA
jgi:copper chaperone NosL